jgi:hypothetical protein
MTERRCGTCRFGGFTDYDRTPTGRFKRGATALCHYEIPVPVLPDSVRGHDREAGYYKVYMSPDDGVTCPTWEEKR